jgi:hypothetical protein
VRFLISRRRAPVWSRSDHGRHTFAGLAHAVALAARRFSQRGNTVSPYRKAKLGRVYFVDSIGAALPVPGDRGLTSFTLRVNEPA